MIKNEPVLSRIVDILKEGERFFLAAHKNPDGDAIGSLLALGEMLLLSGKEALLFNEDPVPSSFSFLANADRIIREFDRELRFDAFFVLDCGNLCRVGDLSSYLSGVSPLVNIDHHEDNTMFGHLNLVDPGSSSVGEIIYRLIKSGDFPMNLHVAEDIFVALQTDTGSFRYDNTSAEALAIAGELVEWGVSPWDISRYVLDGYTIKRLKLLEETLKTLELHHDGKLGMITITRQMFSKTRADCFDSDRFVDYPRLISGVEIGVLIREIEKDQYKFSLRSNDWVNVADLAGHFGGGGHPRAAAFSTSGELNEVKQKFLGKAHKFLHWR